MQTRSLAFDRFNVFGPQPVNLMLAGDTDIVDLLSIDTKFFPTLFQLEVAYQKGTLSTAPVVVFDNGTDASNVSASLTLTGAAINKNFHVQPLTTVMPTITGTGKLRLKKSTLGVGQATTLRERTANVAKLTTAAAHGLAVGDTVVVASVGVATYNGEVKVLSVPSSTTFTYASVGTTEASTADTAGRVGACYVNVWAAGIYW
jgi:hypothetical protein